MSSHIPLCLKLHWIIVRFRRNSCTKYLVRKNDDWIRLNRNWTNCHHRTRALLIWSITWNCKAYMHSKRVTSKFSPLFVFWAGSVMHFNLVVLFQKDDTKWMLSVELLDCKNCSTARLEGCLFYRWVNKLFCWSSCFRTNSFFSVNLTLGLCFFWNSFVVSPKIIFLINS